MGCDETRSPELPVRFARRTTIRPTAPPMPPGPPTATSPGLTPLEFSSDDRVLLAYGLGSMGIYDAETGGTSRVLTLPGAETGVATFAPDGTIAVASKSGSIQLYCPE